MREIVSLITPLLLHMIVSELTVMLFGSRLDPAVCTTIAALVVIPAALMMYRRDRGSFSTGTGQSRSEGGSFPGDRGECSSLRDERATRSSLWDVRTARNSLRDERAARSSLRDERATRSSLRGERAERSVRWSVCFGIFCLAAGSALNILWSGILNAMHISDYFSNQTQEALLGSQMLIQVIGLGIIVPIAEELVFRGLIYTRMKRFFPYRISMFLSALLFAVYHGNPIQMIFAFPMAIVLAVVYERGRFVTFPVLFHIGANLTAVFLNFL